MRGQKLTENGENATHTVFLELSRLRRRRAQCRRCATSDSNRISITSAPKDHQTGSWTAPQMSVSRNLGGFICRKSCVVCAFSSRNFADGLSIITRSILNRQNIVRTRMQFGCFRGPWACGCAGIIPNVFFSRRIIRLNR